MRIIEEKVDINYIETHEFFKKRAEKFQEDNPYSVTMYQDNNADLVKNRNFKEVQKLYPLLKLNNKSKVLDVACGIGRWADAIKDEIQEYCGIDFSDELIGIAKERNKKENFHFYTGNVFRIEQVLKKHNDEKKYNVILVIGILMYLNDTDLMSMLRQIEKVSEENAVICIRELIGIHDRLTLKNFYSKELEDNYNAIYRTREELSEAFQLTVLKKGYRVQKEGVVFEEKELNNRKETSQYYFILER